MRKRVNHSFQLLSPEARTQAAQGLLGRRAKAGDFFLYENPSAEKDKGGNKKGILRAEGSSLATTPVTMGAAVVIAGNIR
ncbi:hypothetical protein EVAR_92470_1 [Eumeta japonica]|uniref:Uncharacterized protein n=1 Tax=Eumeta variegata TaxID=151549 RepID=A0A4C1T620_EUMVA|nr:hypothetical protein EVAR_92470_1 [Eumeta japonica]